MKFKVGDKVLVTAGKDKGKRSTITQVLPKKNKVVVANVNLYTKHIPPMPALDRPGDRVRQERPIYTAKIAIINDQGEPDRIGYRVTEDGVKTRIFKKTGQPVPDRQAEAVKAAAQSEAAQSKVNQEQKQQKPKQAQVNQAQTKQQLAKTAVKGTQQAQTQTKKPA
jgi:large subunit ribosomal protein L24